MNLSAARVAMEILKEKRERDQARIWKNEEGNALVAGEYCHSWTIGCSNSRAGHDGGHGQSRGAKDL